MRLVHGWVTTGSLVFLVALAVRSDASDEKEATPILKLERSIALPGVEGRIDHMAVDADGNRLVVAALENASVEIVDLAAGKVVHSIHPLAEPQGVAILQATVLPGPRRIAVACGGDGTLRLYDGTTLEPSEKLSLGDDADNVRVEAATGRLVVAYGSGGLAIVEKGRVTTRIPLSGHPEAFELETAGTRVFVNVPPSGHVAVADRATGRVVATWNVELAKSNYPMALDETRHRLFVGCRSPAKLLVLDTETGKTVTSLDVVGDVDDIWYDAPAKRLYVTGGQGTIDVLEQTDADHYKTLARVETAGGARTSLFVASQRVLYVAVPRRGGQRAELRVYSVAR